jgi:hypothetical protein
MPTKKYANIDEMIAKLEEENRKSQERLDRYIESKKTRKTWNSIKKEQPVVWKVPSAMRLAPITVNGHNKPKNIHESNDLFIGEYNEEKNRQDFQAALEEWRMTTSRPTSKQVKTTESSTEVRITPPTSSKSEKIIFPTTSLSYLEQLMLQKHRGNN